MCCLQPPDELTPEPGWRAIDISEPMGMGRSFVSGEPDGDRLRVRYFKRERDGAMVGKVWFGPGAEGPPGHAHGGSMAALLDEVMGGAAFLAGHVVLAGRLTIEYKNMMPLGTVATFEARVDRVDGRKVIARGRLLLPDGKEAAVGEGLFVQIDKDKLSELFEVASRWFEGEGKP